MIIMMQWGGTNVYDMDFRGDARIDTEWWFRDSGGIRDFRKLLKLAQRSDREHGTDAVNDWRAAVLEEQMRIREMANSMSDTYNQNCAIIRKEYDDPGVPHEAKRDKLKRMESLLKQQRSIFDQKIKALTKRMERTKKMLKYCEEVQNNEAD